MLKKIRQRAEPNHQAGMMMVTRTQLKVYGVRIPRLQQIARDWQRAHKDITREDLTVLVEGLWDGELMDTLAPLRPRPTDGTRAGEST